MCVIVDANLASAVFSRPPADEMRPVIAWLLKGKGVLIHGGRLTVELRRLAEVRKTLVELRRAGKAIDVEAEDPFAFAKDFAWCKERCRSNDPHLLVIARRSGARTLVTNDKHAMDDFRDRKLVPAPAGRIYQRQEHAKLLTHTRGCRSGEDSRPRR